MRQGLSLLANQVKDRIDTRYSVYMNNVWHLKKQTFFPVHSILLNIALPFAKHTRLKQNKVRSKTRSSPTLGVTLAAQDALLLLFPHLGIFHEYPTASIHSMSHSNKENQFSAVTPTSQCLGHQGGTANESKQHATAVSMS